eukprot:scaffold453343_cov56-Prasinocladus_malaysianus.AAC.1
MELQEKLRGAEAEKLALEGEIQTLKDSVGSMKAEGEREVRKKERVEKEMKELKSALETRQLEIKQKQSLVAAADEQVGKENNVG